jgi:hypothetical protein
MLTWKDFFDFSDDQSISEAVATIERLERTYQKMIGAVEDSNQRLAGDLGAVQSHAEELLKTVSGLNIGLEKNQKVLAESSSASEDLVKEYMALKTVQAENEKQITSLQIQLDKLTDAKERAKKVNDAEAGSIDDLRVRLAEAEKAYKAMGSATDQALKDEQLEKVRGLAKEYKAVDGALKEAKKGAINAAGSYNELAGRVAEAKKQLKQMEGGLDGNSKEFKELKKFAKEGTEQLKEWDEAVGDNQRKVGDYAGEIGKIAPGFAGMISNIEGATAAGKAFIATPLGLILLAIAAALASVTAYFKGSIEGQDDFNKVIRVGEAILETFMDVVEFVGKAIYETFVRGLEDPKQALKDFGDFIVNNIVNRLRGVNNILVAQQKILKSGFTDGWKDLGNAIIQATTGITEGIDKMTAAAKEATDEMKKRVALGEQIAALENRLRKERIADILDDAKTELAVIQLLVEAKDDLTFSDEVRFKKLRQANDLLEDQLRGDLDLIRSEIELQKMIIQQNGETYEERQKLVELQAQEVNLQTHFFQQRKKRQQEEIALIRAVAKEMIESRQRIADANAALESIRLNDVIKTNQKILADDNATLEQRLDALFRITDANEELLEQDRDKQLEVAKEAALGRIELSADAIQEIYNQESLSVAERIALERSLKEQLLSTDQAYMTETLKITEDFNNKTRELNDATTKAAEDNVFKVLARDADRLRMIIGTEVNEQITALDQALAEGNLSVAAYEAQKEDILKNGIRAQLSGQLDYLEKELALVGDNAQKRIQIEEKISKTRRDLAEQTAEDILEYEKRLAENIQEIQGESVALATELFNGNIQRNIEGLETKLTAEEEAKNKSIAIVGDDAQAKAAIEQEFANKEKEIQKQIAAEKRKQAIFQKAVDATGIVINTAKGISTAVAQSPLTFGLPWSAFVAVTGALQLARVLSAPIPQFFMGTKFSPEGLAEVADRGREIVIDPSGNASLYEKPTVLDMGRGSKVLPNYKTEEILRQANQEDLAWQQLVSDSYRDATDKIGSPGVFVDTMGIISSVEQMKIEMVEAIKNQPQDFYDDKGYRHFENGVNARIHSLNKRYTLQ